MVTGKAISLFLIDGTPTGRILCELFNWTGKAYRIPRNMLRESANRSELYKTGVYFLFGRDESDPEKPVAYVGEAEEVLSRLAQHQDKDYWTEAVIFISKDENLNKAHVKFLEHQIVETARSAKRVDLRNANTPNCPAISESEQAVMLEFFANLKLLVGTLGYRIFEPLTQSQPTGVELPIYTVSGSRGANAKAVLTSEGIVVQEGSLAAFNYVPSTPEWAKSFRERLIEEQVLIKQENELRFVKDYLFSSPSAAAAVVLGRSANGRVEWKDNLGRTLKDNEEVIGGTEP